MAKVEIYKGFWTREQVVDGYADEEVRQSVFDKVFRFYSPLLKKAREQK